ncbi:MAG: protein kinase domain-containing protein, partial [Polyangiales bacterium]
MQGVDAAILERFELLGLAGSGGMARVFRARERATAELVALKLLPASGGDRVRFEREMQILASLDHPGVVRYREGGATESGTPFLVMEWLEGRDLGEELSRGPLDVERTMVLARRLAEALAAAHARGIVHRDLKPANVFLVEGEVDRAKLI